MAGAVSTICRELRPVLAECLMLGMSLPDEAAEHVGRCAECRREVADIEDVVRVLRRAASPAPAAPRRAPDRAAAPPDLGDKVRRRIAEVDGTRKRRRRAGAKIAVAAAAAAAILVPVVQDNGRSPAPAAQVALARAGAMIPQSWGTEVPIVVTGLRPGQTYRLMTADTSGDYAPGGSVRIAGDEAVHVNIMTAMPRQVITALLVEDQDGRIVARVPVSPGSGAAAA